jgi:hypothetical protein
MALEKMQALANYLRSRNIFAAEQLDYWMENGTANFSAKKVGQGILLCRFQYDAVFSVERYSNNPDLFLAIFCCWLQDHDGSRSDDDLAMPSIDVTPMNDSTTDIEVKLQFIEEITAVEDANGELEFNGKRWQLQSVAINDADTVGVGNTQTLPTDKNYHRD